ncbi:MAG: nicotinate (nicotinamide) nucleotide adenylyltransferase [Henriciella sp.]|nr:nicotinate (nicotinamide) nucleotide adenylyltransferase [Henriciella sp.]
MPRLRPAAHLPPAGTRQRIGLFGGSFDPPHSGHLHVAETALKRLRLDQVWWFPTPGNPLKAPPGEFDARLAAVQVLTAQNKAMRISDIEMRAHLTYSIDLIRLVRAHCPQAQLVWLIGADSLMTMHYWKDWRQIAATIPIAVVARPGFELAARTSHFARIFRDARLPARSAVALPGHKTPAWTYLNAPLNRMSSTALRKRRK